MDKIVKANREILALSMLCQKPLCGYDLIKEIFEEYNVLLSQGTVYPILYSLEEDGLLRAEYSKGNMRTKLYSITPEGKTVADKKINAFIKAIENLLIFLKR